MLDVPQTQSGSPSAGLRAALEELDRLVHDAASSSAPIAHGAPNDLRSAARRVRGWLAPAADSALDEHLRALVRRAKRVHQLDVALSHAPTRGLSRALGRAREVAAARVASWLREGERLERLSGAFERTTPIDVPVLRERVARLARDARAEVATARAQPPRSRLLRSARRAVSRLHLALMSLRAADGELGHARDRREIGEDVWDLERALATACDLDLARRVVRRLGAKPSELRSASRSARAVARSRALASMDENVGTLDALARTYGEHDAPRTTH